MFAGLRVRVRIKSNYINRGVHRVRVTVRIGDFGKIWIDSGG